MKQYLAQERRGDKAVFFAVVAHATAETTIRGPELGPNVLKVIVILIVIIISVLTGKCRVSPISPSTSAACRLKGVIFQPPSQHCPNTPVLGETFTRKQQDNLSVRIRIVDPDRHDQKRC